MADNVLVFAAVRPPGGSRTDIGPSRSRAARSYGARKHPCGAAARVNCAVLRVFRGAPRINHAAPRAFRAAPRVFRAAPRVFCGAPRVWRAVSRAFRAAPRVFRAVPRAWRAVLRSFCAAPARPEHCRATPPPLGCCGGKARTAPPCTDGCVDLPPGRPRSIIWPAFFLCGGFSGTRGGLTLPPTRGIWF